MSTTVIGAGNLAGAPEPRHARENGKPSVTSRVLVDRRIQTTRGSGSATSPPAHSIKVFDLAATHVHDTCGSGDPVFVHGLKRTESQPHQETGERRTKDVVVVDNRLGEVGLSLKNVSAPKDQAPHATQAS